MHLHSISTPFSSLFSSFPSLLSHYEAQAGLGVHMKPRLASYPHLCPCLSLPSARSLMWPHKAQAFLLGHQNMSARFPLSSGYHVMVLPASLQFPLLVSPTCIPPNTHTVNLNLTSVSWVWVCTIYLSGQACDASITNSPLRAMYNSMGYRVVSWAVGIIFLCTA